MARKFSGMQDSTSLTRTQTYGALALLLAINLFNYIDRYILAAVEPLISDHFFGVNDTTAMAKTGSLATAFLFSYMILAPIFGWLADRFSRWLIVAFGVALWSLASGASGLASVFLALVITRVFVGVGEAAYGPAAPTIISDLFPVEKRSRMLAFFYIAIPVGSAIGYAFGGAIGQRWGWRWPFYLVTIPGLILAIFCLFMRDPRGVRARAKEQPSHPRITLADGLAFFRIRSFTMNTAAMAAMTFAMGGISFWVPRYLFKYRAADFGGHPDLGQINFMFGAITASAGLLATVAGGWIGDFVRRRYASAYFLVSAATIFFAFPATVLMLHTPFPTAWVLVFLAVFFLFFNTGPANAALANVIPSATRSTAFALNIFIIHLLGDAISPPLIGWIADQTTMNFAFLVVSAMMVVAAAFWLMGARYLGQDTAAVVALEEGGGGETSNIQHPIPDTQ
jgi:MFS family permease